MDRTAQASLDILGPEAGAATWQAGDGVSARGKGLLHSSPVTGDPWTARRLVTPGVDGNELVCFAISFDPSRFEAAWFDQHGVLQPDSIRRSVQKRQAEFFFGRLTARLAMAALGAPTAEIVIGPQREPVWPHGIVGSISHTGGLAMATAARPSRCHGIGIDVERAVSGDARDSIASSVLDAAEMAILDRHCAGMEDGGFSLAFSAKESLYKGAFPSVQRFFDFAAARIVAVDTATRTLHLRLTEHLSQAFPEGRRCEIGYDPLEPGIVLTHFLD